MKKTIIRSGAIIVTGIVVGFLMLCLVYCIPTEMMVDAGYESNGILESEGSYGYEYFSLRILDNFTDAIMLNTASYHSGESIWKNAVEAFHAKIPDMDLFQSYVAVASGSAVEAEQESYSRYWHGYLVFLKPLYALFNYAQLRNINMVLQFSALMVALILLNKKFPKLCFPFFLSVMLLAPSAIYKSLQFSSVYYVMLFSSIIFLWNPGKILNGKKVIWFFLTVGIVTVYLDFLTYPTATLTIPLALFCYREKDGKLKENLKLAFLCMIMWGAGYALMWAGKWVLALISGGEAFHNDLISSIKFRSSATNHSHTAISRAETLKRAFAWTFSDKLWAIATAIFSAICLARIGLNLRTVKKRDFSLGLLLLVPVMCRLTWVLVLTNHTAIHLFFTYRTVVPIVFCALTFLSVLAETAEEERLKAKAVNVGQ